MTKWLLRRKRSVGIYLQRAVLDAKRREFLISPTKKKTFAQTFDTKREAKEFLQKHNLGDQLTVVRK